MSISLEPVADEAWLCRVCCERDGVPASVLGARERSEVSNRHFARKRPSALAMRAFPAFNGEFPGDYRMSSPEAWY